MWKILRTTNIPFILCRMIVGLIFLSEGIQKFIYPGVVGKGRFAKIGFSNPAFWASFVGCFEICCGVLILFGFLTRLAAIPLLIIMITAFVTTKWPILVEQGFWPMAHEYRTDFSMTLLLILLLIYGAGNHSLDQRIYNREKNDVAHR
jgi:putative oxidoreductase